MRPVEVTAGRCGLLIMTWLACVPAPAEGLRDLADGWLLAPGDQTRVASRQPVTTPSGGAEWWCILGRMQLFGLADLPVLAVSAGSSGTTGGVAWHLDGGWQQTGSDFFEENRIRLRAGLGRRWRGSVAAVRRSMSFAGDVGPTSTAVNLELAIPMDMLGLVGTRLEIFLQLHDGAIRDGSAGRRSLARLVRSEPPVGLAILLESKADGSPVLGLDILCRCGGGLALGLRADPATGSLGPTLVWYRGHFLLRTAHVVHPDLGVTHRVAMVLGCPGAVW